ncbi:MAG: NAD-glutamate dehydrogenase [Gammaproteobacteria bacterium]
MKAYNDNDELLEHLSEFIREQSDDANTRMLADFARYYFKAIPLEDLEGMQRDDLYGAVLTHWNLALNFIPGTEKIHIYNPTLEQHGWQSSHTVIDIVIDDMPFLLQSVTMEINRHGFASHLVMHPVFSVERSQNHDLTQVYPGGDMPGHSECMLHLEIDRQANPAILDLLRRNLRKVLVDVRAVTEDWQSCLNKMSAVIDELKALNQDQRFTGVDDSILFLQWLHDDHFVFLGYREYDLIMEDDGAFFKALAGSGLGVLRDAIADSSDEGLIPITLDAFQRINTGQPLLITKATRKATVHRPVFMDYIGIKRYDTDARVIGEKRFLGLYSAAAYTDVLINIPMVSSKIRWMVARSGFRSGSHGARTLLFILQSLPRDEVFQADQDVLFDCVMGVLQLQERQRVRVFVRHDVYGHFVSLLIYVPRDRYHTESRKKIQQILLQIFKGENVDFSVQLSESILARIHFIIYSADGCCIDYDIKQLEQQIKEALSEWRDDLKKALLDSYGEALGNDYLQAYSNGFSAAYREDNSPRTALLDLKRFEQLERQSGSILGLLYSPMTASEHKTLHFRLYCQGFQAPLSDSLPMLENMGVKVCDERPYRVVKQEAGESFWIHDFGLNYEHVEQLDLDELKPRFQESFEQCWNKKIENDGFNRLIIKSGLNWRQVNIVRALYFYLRQLGIAFSQAYVETTLANNPVVVRLLIDLFFVRFEPGIDGRDERHKQCIKALESEIEQVGSLDEDRILRKFLNLIGAAVRTNYFNESVDTKGISFLSIKFDSALISDMPSPVPYFEIFVYSPRMEGVHLRGGAVSRGGLRWSDRREDFRTEILGLMKAQVTKNSVIVPTGAKGGFVVKKTDAAGAKEILANEGIDCYRILIRGLLDLTDNIVSDQVIKPDNAVCYDGDDPYLVVAADKGTARFSDHANELSKQYGFWLGDAFASGGSAGYDHKAMGITARGAWESVKHHFAEAAIDIHSAFTVIGIGGMAGDVFGNGMLLSKAIKLVGVFDNECIFLDPNPDPEQAFQERKRLFALPHASWRNYDPKLISLGGGVFSRRTKAIDVTPEVRALLQVSAERMTPHELIKALLCAPVDLLWNGGIGTYVKASEESNAEVGDRANDSVRVSGNELRCRVVAEGGNLGFTQAGRIEYALAGGRINNDSIDNSAGVDCSDHEVNIKILLNALVRQGDLTEKHRDELLTQMTEEVAELVLDHNYRQNRAIATIVRESFHKLQIFQWLIQVLEKKGHLNRKRERIPQDAALAKRLGQGRGLTRPEVAVLLAYGKQLLKTELLAVIDNLDKTLFSEELAGYFPVQLQRRFGNEIQTHRLANEIVANQLVNGAIDRLGIAFPYRLMEETSCSPANLANTYKCVCKILAVDELWSMLQELDGHINPDIHAEVQQMVRKTIERSMYWFLRNEPVTGSETLIARVDLYSRAINELAGHVMQWLPESERQEVDRTVQHLIEQGIPSVLAVKAATLDTTILCLNAIKVHARKHYELNDVAKTLFFLLSELNLTWLRKNVAQLPRDSMWDSLARRSMMEVFDTVCCDLTVEILQQDRAVLTDKLDAWRANNAKAIERYQGMIVRASADTRISLDKVTVILKELAGLRIEK